MMKFVKSYHVFLTNRVLMYVVYPTLLFLATVWNSFLTSLITEHTQEMNILPCAVLTGCIVIGAESLFDSFVFGGILSRDSIKLDVLKTSVRGEGILNRALIVDKLRRVLMMIVALLIGYHFCHNGGSILQLLGFAFLAVSIMEGTLMITRRVISSMYLMMLLFLAALLCALAGGLAFALPEVVVPGFLILYVLIFVISQKHIMNKFRTSFFDKQEKNKKDKNPRNEEK